MKYISFLSLALAAALYSCGNNTENKTADLSADTLMDTSFDRFKEAFIEKLWVMYPAWASGVGYHKHDSVLVVPDEAFHKKEVEFANQNLDSLKKFELAKLSSSNKTDYLILENALNAILFSVNEFKEYEWNPASYNVSGSFAEILQSKHASFEDKLRDLHKRMATIPAYYEAAKKSIKNPTIEHTDLGIQQNRGGLDVFNSMLMDSLKKSNLDEQEIQVVKARIKESVKAIEGYTTWLEKEVKPTLKPESARSFRIGKDLYEKKFRHDIVSRYTAEEIYNKAQQRKEELQAEMLKITKELFNKYFPQVRLPGEMTKEHTKMLIDEISKKHVNRDSFQVAIEKQIPELTKFVSDKNQ